MLKKYNIALLSTSKNEEIIHCADYFSKISDQYKLGRNSFPHVTLCHFQANPNELNFLWETINKKINQHTLTLKLDSFSCVTFDNKIYWVSLMPDQRDTLNNLHQIVSTIVKQKSNKTYDPHLTLINTKDIHYKKIADEFYRSYKLIIDDFILALGERDEVGQFTKLLYCNQNQVKHKVHMKF